MLSQPWTFLQQPPSSTQSPETWACLADARLEEYWPGNLAAPGLVALGLGAQPSRFSASAPRDTAFIRRPWARSQNSHSQRNTESYDQDNENPWHPPDTLCLEEPPHQRSKPRAARVLAGWQVKA